MSRSCRKLPFIGITTAVSEKEDKRFANRKERRLNREMLHSPVYDTLLCHKRGVGNPWLFAKSFEDAYTKGACHSRKPSIRDVIDGSGCYQVVAGPSTQPAPGTENS